MGANPSNPDGHFEDRDIVELHKRMLPANHRDWYTPGPELSDNVQGFDKQTRDILKKFPVDRSMGFKSGKGIPGIAEAIDVAFQSELDATLDTLNELSSTEAEPECQGVQGQLYQNVPSPAAAL